MKKLLSLAILAAALTASVGCDDKKSTGPKGGSSPSPAGSPSPSKSP
jgi:hypothetical protein